MSLNPDVAANLQTGKFLVVWEYAYNEPVRTLITY
jgi:hypothetical protein